MYEAWELACLSELELVANYAHALVLPPTSQQHCTIIVTKYMDLPFHDFTSHEMSSDIAIGPLIMCYQLIMIISTIILCASIHAH